MFAVAGGGSMSIWMWMPSTVSLSVNWVEPAKTDMAGVKDARIAARTRTVAPSAVSFRTFHVSCRNAAAGSPISVALGMSRYLLYAPNAIIGMKRETFARMTQPYPDEKR